MSLLFSSSLLRNTLIPELGKKLSEAREALASEKASCKSRLEEYLDRYENAVEEWKAARPESYQRWESGIEAAVEAKQKKERLRVLRIRVGEAEAWAKEWKSAVTKKKQVEKTLESMMEEKMRLADVREEAESALAALKARREKEKAEEAERAKMVQAEEETRKQKALEEERNRKRMEEEEEARKKQEDDRREQERKRLHEEYQAQQAKKRAQEQERRNNQLRQEQRLREAQQQQQQKPPEVLHRSLPAAEPRTTASPGFLFPKRPMSPAVSVSLVNSPVAASVVTAASASATPTPMDTSVASASNATQPNVCANATGEQSTTGSLDLTSDSSFTLGGVGSQSGGGDVIGPVGASDKQFVQFFGGGGDETMTTGNEMAADFEFSFGNELGGDGGKNGGFFGGFDF